MPNYHHAGKREWFTADSEKEKEDEERFRLGVSRTNGRPEARLVSRDRAQCRAIVLY
jgi:hypothetical protein